MSTSLLSTVHSVLDKFLKSSTTNCFKQMNILEKNNQTFSCVTIKYYNIFLYMALIYSFMFRIGGLFI